MRQAELASFQTLRARAGGHFDLARARACARFSSGRGGAQKPTEPRSARERLAIERLGESGATHDSQSASRSGVEAWVARNLNGWDDSDAGVTAYSFPPRKRAPAHKFASEFVHHPRK